MPLLSSRVYDRQNRRGEEYDVPPVFLIGLMGIEVKHEKPELWKERYVSEYSFREKLTNELPDDTIFIIFADYITLNVPPRAFSNVPLQIWSL